MYGIVTLNEFFEFEEGVGNGHHHQFIIIIIIIIIILWAGAQPTLDPYAEAFIAGPLR